MLEYSVNETGVAFITFARDEKRNAINGEMADQILLRLEQAAKDARVVVLRANRGISVWCAGHDLAELDPRALDANPTLEIVEKIQSLPIPVLAMVEGAVYGGGLLILLGADIVVATPNAEVAITSNKLGIPLPSEVYAFWLRVMGLHKAKELLFTAAVMSAEEAYRFGIYNHVVEPDQLERVISEIAGRIVACSAEGLANTKLQLNLIASQSALETEDLRAIKQRNAELLGSPTTEARIATLLATLRNHNHNP